MNILALIGQLKKIDAEEGGRSHKSLTQQDDLFLPSV